MFACCIAVAFCLLALHLQFIHSYFLLTRGARGPPPSLLATMQGGHSIAPMELSPCPLDSAPLVPPSLSLSPFLTAAGSPAEEEAEPASSPFPTAAQLQANNTVAPSLPTCAPLFSPLPSLLPSSPFSLPFLPFFSSGAPSVSTESSVAESHSTSSSAASYRDCSAARNLRTQRQTASSSLSAIVEENVHPFVEAALLSEPVLSALLPSSSLPLPSLLLPSPDSSFPVWLQSAVQCVFTPQSKPVNTRQRFLLAVACALEIDDTPLSDAAALACSVAELVEKESESSCPLGRGIHHTAVQRLSKSFAFATSHTTAANLERIDAATRCLLRLLQGHRAALIPILEQIHDAALPPDSTVQRYRDKPPRIVPVEEVTVAAPSCTAPSPPTPAPLSPFLPLRSVSVLPISGEGNKCLFLCAALALGLETVEVQSVLRDTLESISEAPVLCSYGFNIDCDADASTVAKVKADYLCSSSFVQMEWGGERELYLLSHAKSGKVAFLIVDELKKGTSALQSIHSIPPGAEWGSDTAANICTQFALHHCTYKGLSAAKNHYNLFRYTLENGQQQHAWSQVQAEPAPHRERRERLLKATALQASHRTKTAAAVEEEAARALLMQQYGQSPSSPLPASSHPSAGATKRRNPGRPRGSGKGARDGTIAAAAATRGSPDSPAAVDGPASLPPHRPSHTLSLFRVLPKSCYHGFRILANPYLESYLALSRAGDEDGCAAVLNELLDLPRHALIKGNGKAKGLLRSMEAHQSHFTTLVQRGVLSRIPSHTEGLPSPVEHSFPPSSPRSLSPPLHAGALVDAVEVDSNSDSDSESIISPADAARARCVDRAKAIVREGGPRCLSRAAKALLQLPSAPVNEETIQQLRALHPPSVGAMDPLPEERAKKLVAVDPISLLRLLKLRVNNGSAPGPSGWTGDHLMVLAQGESEDAKGGLCALVRDLCNGIFTGALQERLLSCTLMPIWKKEIGGGIRPIAIGEVFVKLAAHYSMSLVEVALPSLFPRIQYGVKRAGGSESAAQLTRAVLEESRRTDPTTVALKTDFANAFNATSRAQAWRTLLDKPSTSPIWRMFHWAYSLSSPLLVFDEGKLHTRLASAEGMRQGDPFAAFAFALCVQGLYESVLEGFPEVKAISVLDDLTLVGPVEKVVLVFDRITQRAKEFHLQLRTEKCQVYIPHQLEDAAIVQRIHAACESRSLQYDTRIEALGVIFGSDEQVLSHAAKSVESHAQFFHCLTHPNMPVQTAFSILRYCGIPRLSFLSRTIPPPLFLPSAARFDDMVRGCFDSMMQIDARSRSLLAPTVTAEQLELRISMPIGRGGMGMRPFTRIAHAAYFSSLATILPDFCTSFPNCPDVAATALHNDMEECRRHFIHSGVDKPVKSLKEIHQIGVEGRRTYKRKETRTEKPSRAFSFHSPPPFLSSSPSPPLLSTRDFIREDLSLLWRQAKSCAGNAEKTHNFLRERRLQHDLTELLELQLHEKLFTESGKYQRTVLTALTMTAKASAWLTVLPASHELRMDNSSFRLAVRHRLGLLPFDSLRHRRCRYLHCTAADTFLHDPDHFHSCALHRRTLCTARHNNLMQTVITLARKVGFYASREPNHHLRPQENADKFNEHADILLLKHDRKIYIDVTVTRPTTASNLQRPGITSTPLLSTHVRSLQKHSKYDAIARLNGYEFVAFVLESYGGMNDEASSLLHTLASHAPESEQTTFLQFAHQCIAVALQRSNAFISQVATQTMHIEEQRLGGLADSQIRYRARQQQQRQETPTASLEDAGATDSQPAKAKRRQFSQTGLLSPSRAGKTVRQKRKYAGAEVQPTAAAAPLSDTPALIHLIRHEPLLSCPPPPIPSPSPSPPRKKSRITPPSPHRPPPPLRHIHPSRLPQLASLLLPTDDAAVESAVPPVHVHATTEPMECGRVTGEIRREG